MNKRWHLPVVAAVVFATAVFLVLVTNPEPKMKDPQAERPEETPLVKQRQYVICYKTSDYPGKYTVRKYLIFAGRTRPADFLGAYNSLEEARSVIPEGLTRLDRDPRDDPVILEIWIP